MRSLPTPWLWQYTKHIFFVNTLIELARNGNDFYISYPLTSTKILKNAFFVSILSELVQNADDAGARTVRVMLNTREYGDGSLLSPAMSNWQGPSLYVYNDAVFTERDFQNLAKIGQVTVYYYSV